MKTYKKIVDTPRLVISYDAFSNSPDQEYDTLGIILDMSMAHRNERVRLLFERLREQGRDYKNSISFVREEIEYYEDSPVVRMFNLYKHEHSGVTYYIGAPNTCMWDTSFAGFIVVTQANLDNLGVEFGGIEDVIREELADYNCWVNGDVLEYVLYDETGEEIDRNCGIYATEGFDTIKQFLSSEWKDENMEDYVEYSL